MQIKKGEVFILIVAMHNNSFDCVDGAVVFRGGANVASVEVDAIYIGSEMTTRDSVWVDNWEEVENKSVSQDVC